MPETHRFSLNSPLFSPVNAPKPRSPCGSTRKWLLWQGLWWRCRI